jgi:hypothetical protein
VNVYTPQQSMGPSRPTCAGCGAAYRLHRAEVEPNPDYSPAGATPAVRTTGRMLCPEPYRPGTLEVARRELAEAEATGDEARIFVARGNLQHLEGRRTERSEPGPEGDEDTRLRRYGAP